MVVSVNPLDSAQLGEDFDGVVRVRTDVAYGSGVLMPDGRHILTAAHVLSPWPPNYLSMDFHGDGGEATVYGTNVSRPAPYQYGQLEFDLALVSLDNPAPTWAQRHALYRDSGELGEDFTLVGYGNQGSGELGYEPGTGGERLAATNRFEAYGFELEPEGSADAPGGRLLADFDSGLSVNDASPWVGEADLGTSSEGLIAPGDSGGGAFIGDEVAGIAGYTSRVTFPDGTTTDVDSTPNSSFGELGGWARVSYFQEWIDRTMRESYVDAPESVDEVRLRLPEGDMGDSQLAYFLVSFTGIRDYPEQWLSVEYATRDHTATAGEDYLPVSGRLNLYAGETEAVIPVEILGDDSPEPDETFFLDIFNPVGGTFPDGVDTLSASRTIVDDDVLIA